MDHGLVLEKIHRVIEFKQSAWMKEYTDFNTKLRTAAKNDFEKDFYKLMNNSVFGKTMENIRKHRNIKLINNEEEYLQNVMKPNFKSGTLLGSDLMGCEMGKVKAVMNKPVYLGQTMLDLSKTIMYEFHYDYMKCKYDDDNRKNDLILIMTPEKQNKTLELSKHWSADSTPARNEVIMKRTYPVNR